MLPASHHLLPVIGIDIHMIIILGAPVPVPHPFIGLVFDPMDWVPKIGATVNVNGIPRGNSGTNGMLGSKVHIPMGGPFAMAPTIGHDSMNLFGSPRVKAEGSYFTGAGFMVMSCNDVGIPLSITPGKNFKPVPSLYLPTSVSIPIPCGAPVIVGGPYVPDVMGMLMGLVMSFGFGALMKIGGKVLKKALTALNKGVLKKFKCTKGLSEKFCKHGFEPVNLITGSVLYKGVDFEIPGIIPIKWERHWYSDSGYEGLLGHGTHLCYDLTLQIFEEDNAIGVILPDGRAAGFPMLLSPEEKFYLRSEKLTLTCNHLDRYEMFDHNTMQVYTFDRLKENVFKPVSLATQTGVAIKFFYSQKNVLNKIIDTAGRVISLELDDSGRIIQVNASHRGEHRKYVSYDYNEAGDLVGISDAYDKTTIMHFLQHLMVQKTDRNGYSFFWEYDGIGTGSKCVHTYGEDGLLEGWIEYKDGYNLVTNSLNDTRIYYFDERGFCVQETDALGNSAFYEFTESGELHAEIDAAGDLTGYSYDHNGYLTEIQKGDGSKRIAVYDNIGFTTMEQDESGASTIYIYKNGLLISVVKSDQAISQYDYNRLGLVTTIKNNFNSIITRTYDQDHNLESEVAGASVETRWKYDAWGRCTLFYSPERNFRQYTFDEIDRIITVRERDNNIIHFKYDSYRNIIEEFDRDFCVKMSYNPLGSLLASNANGQQKFFRYNSEGWLTGVINEKFEKYTFIHDVNGAVVQEIGFDGRILLFERNEIGSVQKFVSPDKKTTEYEYDNVGRLSFAKYSDGRFSSLLYDSCGRIIQAENENHCVKIKRNSFGDILEEDQDGCIVKSEYDIHGNVRKISINTGVSIDFELDASANVMSVNASNSTGADWSATYLRNTIGQELSKKLPGKIESAFAYNAAGLPETHILTKGSVALQTLKYNWSFNAKLTSLKDGISRRTTNFSYDNSGNLIAGSEKEGDADFRIADSTGNLFRSTKLNDCKYTAGGRLIEDPFWQYQYDVTGNLIQKTSANGATWLYQWREDGLLEQVVDPLGIQTSYTYDALGRRITRTTNGIVRRWIWNSNSILQEWDEKESDQFAMLVDANNELHTDFKVPANAVTWVYDPKSFTPVARLQAAAAESIVTDHLGTPYQMYNKIGERTWAVHYDIYGAVSETIVGNNGRCPFRYQGQYHDLETGLYYNRFRYYCSATGIYISQDPIRLRGGYSLYSYVHDTNWWIDVFGLTGTYFFTDGTTSYVGKGPRDRMLASMGERIGGKGNATLWSHNDFGCNDTGLMVEAELMDRKGAKADPNFANAIESPGKAKLEALKKSDPKAHADILAKADKVEADFKLSKGIKCV